MESTLWDDIARVVKCVLPGYLQEWARDTIFVLEHDQNASVLRRSVNSMAKHFKAKRTGKPHCLTCGKQFSSLELVAKHLRDTLQCKMCKVEFPTRELARAHLEETLHHGLRHSHIYSLRRLKSDVKMVRKLVKAVPRVEDDMLHQQLLLLRVGIALKVATLVRLRGSASFNTRVNAIIGDL